MDSAQQDASLLFANENIFGIWRGPIHAGFQRMSSERLRCAKRRLRWTNNGVPASAGGLSS
jgi:hypothetical protein